MQTFTDLYRYRFVLHSLVVKNFKASYRNMALGFLWSLLNPLVLVTVLSIVWILFLGQGATFPAQVLSALIPYNFFAYCISGCALSIIGNGSLVKKVAFPRQILPVSVILSHLIHFGVQSALLVLLLLVFPHPGRLLGPHLVWLPVVLGLELALCIGSGMLVAALNVVYRDVQYLVDSLMTVMFWLTPIVYEPEQALASQPSAVWVLYYCNPMAGILQAWRAILYHGRTPDLGALGLAAAGVVVVGYVGLRAFWTHEKRFADLI